MGFAEILSETTSLSPKVGVRYAYTSPSRDPICGISPGMLLFSFGLCCSDFSKMFLGCVLDPFGGSDTGAATYLGKSEQYRSEGLNRIDKETSTSTNSKLLCQLKRCIYTTLRFGNYVARTLQKMFSSCVLDPPKVVHFWRIRHHL